MLGLQKNFSAYSAAATAHGFYYMGSLQVPGPLRLVWATATVISLVIAGVIVNRKLQEWDDSPIATDIDIFAFDTDVRHKMSIE